MLRLVVLWFIAGALAAQSLPPEARFVMSHFKSNGGGGDERLWISWSADGLTWSALNGGNPVWQPPGTPEIYSVVRDPTIIHHNGYYWVAYTSGLYGRGNTFGLIKSTDLLNWTIVGQVDASVPDSPDPFTWSPIFFEDGDGSVHVIVAISRINGTTFNVFYDLHVYEMHPLNEEWTEWSTPVSLELPDPNNNDCWIWKEGATYHAAYADFARGGAVVHATSENLITGWVRQQVLGYNSQEGNIILPIPGGGYRLYLEPGNGSGGPIATFRTCDFNQDFTMVTPQVPVISDVPMRNGKICAARGTQTFAGWQTQRLASVPITERAALADPDGDGLDNLSEYGMGTDPISFSSAEYRPRPYLRSMGDRGYGGIRFPWFRQAADLFVAAESRLPSGEWSTAPEDIVVESRTLLSDGTTRIQARSLHRIDAENPTLLRVRASLPEQLDKPRATSSRAKKWRTKWRRR
jgi:hypothetical protein